MIVVKITLTSAIHPTRDKELGTLVIDNIGGDETRSDYRARMYRKGELSKAGGCPRTMMWRTPKPVREARVLGHRKQAEPVGNLVAKALKEMGYG